MASKLIAFPFRLGMGSSFVKGIWYHEKENYNTIVTPRKYDENN